MNTEITTLLALLSINAIACAIAVAMANRKYRPWSIDDLDLMFDRFMAALLINSMIIMSVYIIVLLLVKAVFRNGV